MDESVASLLILACGTEQNQRKSHLSESIFLTAEQDSWCAKLREPWLWPCFD